MDDEIRDLFVEWVQQTQKTGKAPKHAMQEQMAVNVLVYKVSETLMVQDMTRKIEEMPSGNQRFLN
jgi:hypothetical protein